LYSFSENDQKTLETMKFLNQYPADTTGSMMHPLSFTIVLASSAKQMDVAGTFARWSGQPMTVSQQSVLQNHLAIGYFKTVSTTRP
jgi:hypothetical protein